MERQFEVKKPIGFFNPLGERKVSPGSPKEHSPGLVNILVTSGTDSEDEQL